MPSTSRCIRHLWPATKCYSYGHDCYAPCNVVAWPMRPIATNSAAAGGRAPGSRAKHGVTNPRSRDRRHAAGCASGGRSHGYGATLVAQSVISPRVVNVTAPTIASYAITPSAHTSCAGEMRTSRSALAATTMSGGAYESVQRGHFVSPARASRRSPSESDCSPRDAMFLRKVPSRCANAFVQLRGACGCCHEYAAELVYRSLVSQQRSTLRCKTSTDQLHVGP